jgi:hypothetical protein
MAIACFRLVTFRPDPLFNVPFFRRRIVDSTFFEADFPYFAISVPPAIRLQEAGTFCSSAHTPFPGSNGQTTVSGV